MIFGALLILGVTPGPAAASRSDPDLFWGVVNSMYIGNILLLILSIPLVGHLRADPAGAARDPGADHRADHDARRLHDQQLASSTSS